MSDSPAATGVPAQGTLLAGKYRVERVLGQGGMGVVVQATHEQLEQRVAIKFLLPAALSNPEAVARFAREARAATKIQSEHGVRVIDVGTLETGAPYMVMEYLDGHDLGQRLEARKRLEIEESVDYVLQACEALAEAHAAGIVHRDLKPANLFVTQRADGSERVKVLDFGISKVAPSGVDSASMTKTSALMGSPLYMSPEQMKNTKDVDARADVWALGIILHELVAGGPVFEAETMPQLCALILAEPPPPLTRVRPEVPLGLEAAVLRCLAKSPADRFQNVAELAQALAPFAPAHALVSVDRVTRVIQSTGAKVTPSGRGPRASAPGFATGPITAGDARASAPGFLGMAPGDPPVIPGGGRTLNTFAGTHGGAKRPAFPLVAAAATAGLVVVGFLLGGAWIFGHRGADHPAAAGESHRVPLESAPLPPVLIPTAAPDLPPAPQEAAEPSGTSALSTPQPAPSSSALEAPLAGSASPTAPHPHGPHPPAARPTPGRPPAPAAPHPALSPAPSDFGDRK